MWKLILKTWIKCDLYMVIALSFAQVFMEGYRQSVLYTAEHMCEIFPEIRDLTVDAQLIAEKAKEIGGKNLVEEIEPPPGWYEALAKGPMVFARKVRADIKSGRMDRWMKDKWVA